MTNKIIEFAETHPVPVAIGVVVVGLALFLLLSPKGGSSDGGAAAAYYAANAATAQAGDAVQIAQIQAQAGTAQTQLVTGASVSNNTTWATADVTMNAANDATQISLAPFAVQSEAIGALAQGASAPPLTSSSSGSSNGFFGLFGGSHSSTTQTANPIALAAEQELVALINGFNAGH